MSKNIIKYLFFIAIAISALYLIIPKHKNTSLHKYYNNIVKIDIQDKEQNQNIDDEIETIINIISILFVISILKDNIYPYNYKNLISYTDNLFKWLNKKHSRHK